MKTSTHEFIQDSVHRHRFYWDYVVPHRTRLMAQSHNEVRKAIAVAMKQGRQS